MRWRGAGFSGHRLATDGPSILVGKYSSSKMKLDAKNHIILRESDILAMFEE
jgi:co-chaperonin GroES (HSP10)